MTKYIIKPLDTLFFRDGRPFNIGETGQMKVEGVFPPFPTTIVGSMRYALATKQGWKPIRRNADWTKDNGLSEFKNIQASEFREILGDGNELGQLSFSGPHLLYNSELVFPAPAHILAKKTQCNQGLENITRLKPTEKAFDTDLGENIRLTEPEQKCDGIKPLEGNWLTTQGMQAVLDGGVPNSADIIEQKTLWVTEDRIGIRRNSKTHATDDDALYQIQHIRLTKDTSLLMQINNLPKDWQAQSPNPMGGEQRMVWIDEASENLDLPRPDPSNSNLDKFRYTIILITPADFFDDNETNHEQTIAKAVTDLSKSSKLITACVYKPKLVGGWNSRENKPLPLKPVVAAGSTWFLEADLEDKDRILKMNGKHIGKRNKWGFGQILIGIWK